MEQTLGKRIMANRKRLGLTQDQLAERLGVTAQAVSKWENDQSCPDIGTLPKLAALFGVSTDELLGVERQEKVHTAEVTEEKPPRPSSDGKKNLRWDFQVADGVAFGVWVLSAGILYLCAVLLNWKVSLWDVLWPTALVVWGAFGLYPRFSWFRLGCLIFGGYFLAGNLFGAWLPVSGKLVVPVLLVLWGISLLADALRRPKKTVKFHGGQGENWSSDSCRTEDGALYVHSQFCDKTQRIAMDRLERGEVSVQFGDLRLSLSDVAAVAPGCELRADCRFGELTLEVPRRFRVALRGDGSAFGAVNITGEPNDVTEGTVCLTASAECGEISVLYV